MFTIKNILQKNMVCAEKPFIENENNVAHYYYNDKFDLDNMAGSPLGTCIAKIHMDAKEVFSLSVQFVHGKTNVPKQQSAMKERSQTILRVDKGGRYDVLCIIVDLYDYEDGQYLAKDAVVDIIYDVNEEFARSRCSTIEEYAKRECSEFLDKMIASNRHHMLDKLSKKAGEKDGETEAAVDNPCNSAGGGVLGTLPGTEGT